MEKVSIKCKKIFMYRKHKPKGLIIDESGHEIFRDSDGTIERIYSVKSPKARGMTEIGVCFFEHNSKGECLGDVTWAKRVANVINFVNGEIASVEESSDDLFCMFVDPQHTPNERIYECVENALILNNTDKSVVKYIARRIMPYGAARKAYIKNPSREAAWAALVGGDPEAWD